MFKIFGLLILLFYLKLSYSQKIESSYIEKFENLIYYQQNTSPSYYFAVQHSNKKSIIHKILNKLFIFYKKYISSQDGNTCTFTPSCSEYSLISLKKKGLIIGYLDTIDRISRCNTFNYEDYQINSQNKKIDPVE